MLKRKRVEIIFAVIYIVLFALICIPYDYMGKEQKVIEEVMVVEEIPFVEKIELPKTKKPIEEYESLGIFIVTAYCPCYECSEGYGWQTSTGVTAEEGRTIAIDPNVIPYGTKVYIDGKEYTAEDCGGWIKGNDIDVFFDTHEEVDEWGRKEIEVFIRVGG